jgi:DNA invertase Pin-like site-specific DNA recombinase
LFQSYLIYLTANAECFSETVIGHGHKTAGERRPHPDQCLADGRAGQFDIPLTYDFSRLARDGRLWTNLVHDLGLAGVRAEDLTLPPDETPVGEFMRWIMAGVGQLARATIRERTHAGRLAKARSGQFVTGRRPYGYCGPALTRSWCNGMEC